MTGAVINPARVAATVDVSTAQTLSPSYINSFRISAVTNRLLVHLRGDANTDNTEFFNLCLSLARGIDYAVANNEIPGRASDLPFLLKQVCQQKNNPQLLAAVMVLMMSVKNACNNGWFSEKEKEELYVLSEEIQSSFCSVSVKDMNSNTKNKESTFRPVISMIMSRFYPGMKMGEILALVEATPGYNSYMTDLHISKKVKSSPDDKIYLFVAQTDNIETSSCIVSPQQVNFLLNGEGVDWRTCVQKDPGPQIPTHVTHMLKYGSNLLQAVGQFNGRYIIIVSFMSVVANPTRPTLPDYVPPAAAAPDSDNEIIEGPSRISLKCPISFSRIKIPVKGRSCKHLLCFDFDNYVGINSRRPLWRCPHCSQSVCFHDIRIDQTMVKVLNEVGSDVSHVKISSDGSWEAITETSEHTDKPHDTTPLQQEPIIPQSTDANVLDLTEADNEMDTSAPQQDNIDKNPPPLVKNSIPTSVDTNNNIQRNIAPHMEDAFWREFYSSSLATRTTNVGPTSVQLQQYENVNDIGTYGYMRYPNSARYVTRNPVAVQALSAQSRSHLSLLQQMSTQNLGYRNHPSQTNPQLGAHSAAPQQVSGSRHTDRPGSHPQPSINQRFPQPVRSSAQPSPHIRLGGVGHMPGLGTSQSNYSMAYAHAAAQIRSRTPSGPDPVQTSGSPVPVVSTGEQRDSSAEQNWRPAGRMRGSLSGKAYAEALNRFIVHPNQPVQAARPPVLNAPRPFIPPHLQALMANNMKAQAQTQTQMGQAGGPDPDSNIAGAGAAGGSPSDC